MNDEVPMIAVTPDELFELEPPKTQTEILRAVWKDLQIVKAQVRATNGRVGDLEKFKWLTTGALIVIAAVVVPIFLGLVART